MVSLSIIMPLYNTKPSMLKKAIESVLNQSYSHFEFIIVCDKPTDGSDIIAKEYAKQDDRIVIIENKENCGVAKSLNAGIDKSTGSFIARMDADDVSLPTRFEKQITYLQNNNNVDLVFSRVSLIDQNDQLIKRKSKYLSDNTIMSTLFIGCMLYHPTVMFRRSAINHISPLYANDKKAEDYDLWVRLFVEGKNFVQLPDTLYLYRTHSNQITKTNDKKLENDSLQTLHTLINSFGINCTLSQVASYRRLMSSDKLLKIYDFFVGSKIFISILIHVDRINHFYLIARFMFMFFKRLLNYKKWIGINA